MRPRCSVFIATSLDGFIAREDGSFDWLPGPESGVTDHGYDAFMSSIDGLVLGRATYDFVRTLGPWPFGTRRAVVLSRSSPPVAPLHAPFASLHPGPPRAALDVLASLGCQHLYVDGGATIQSFLAEGLIDDLTITTIPILIGSGRRLFGALPADVRLELLAAQPFPGGLSQSHWRVVNPAP